VAIAQVLGSRETGSRSLLDEIKEQLRTKKMLLLLDNFEQVTAAARKVLELLQACPQLKLLVTSREALHVRGEYVFPVPPLELPNHSYKQSTTEQLVRNEAVQLFSERAQAVKHNFKLTDENLPVVAEICQRLDGLPLAIELAAARIRLFPPQALLERLGSRLKLLRGGARDLPARQQTLRDAINWSYELLDSGEQCVFELLSVFSGGCSLDAVETTASGTRCLNESGLDMLDGITSLVEKSLIRQMDQDGGEPRLMMLETMREFAVERLEVDPDFSAYARRAHAIYYADFAQLQWGYLTGDQRAAALADLGADIENIRAAWQYWVREKDLEQLSKIVDSLWLFYDLRGWFHAAVDLADDLLDVLATIPSTPERIQKEIIIRTSLARTLLAIEGYTPQVEEAYQHALALCQGEEDIPQLFPVLRGLSSFYIYLGEFEKAAQMGERILRLAERHNDMGMLIEGHLVFGYNLAFYKDLNEGLAHLEKVIAYYDPDQTHAQQFRIGNNPGVVAFNISAFFLWMLGYPDQALARAHEAIALGRKLDQPYSLAYALFHAGMLYHWLRKPEHVEECAGAVLDIAEEYNYHVWKAVGTCLRGAALAQLGQPQEGLVLGRTGMDLYQGLNTPPVFWSVILYLQAEIYNQAGKPEQGLSLVRQIPEDSHFDSGRILGPEFLRLIGDLLVAVTPDNAAEAESWYQKALETALDVQAKMLALRVAISLSRLWHDQGKDEQGGQLLRGIVEKFSEGFQTADLMEAEEFLSSVQK
jgi:predicted ATPase